MNYDSDFNPEVSEYIYQQIEEVKAFVSDDALFLVEQVSDNEILLKVKEGNTLYKVESQAETLMEAMYWAKEKMISMILRKQDSKFVTRHVYEEKHILN